MQITRVSRGWFAVVACSCQEYTEGERSSSLLLLAYIVFSMEHTTNERPVPHYYGDITRAIFIIAGIVVLIGFPAVTKQFDIPVIFAVIAIVVLAIAGGITNPVQYNSLVLNVWVALAGLVVFIYLSWFMREQGATGIYLASNQLLAACFLVASYLSVKSLRGHRTTIH